MKIVIDVPDKLFLETVKAQMPKLHQSVVDGIELAFGELSFNVTVKTKEVMKAALWKAFIGALGKVIPE